MTCEVQARLDQARTDVAAVLGRGTVARQTDDVSRFYGEIRTLLADALRSHLDCRIREFADAIRMKAESVGPQIREASEGLLGQRLQAVESALQVASEGQKELVAKFLNGMIGMLQNFAASPQAVASPPRIQRPREIATTAPPVTAVENAAVEAPELLEQHYEIPENATGFTYERIFRPYMDGAKRITIEDPYIPLAAPSRQSCKILCAGDSVRRREAN